MANKLYQEIEQLSTEELVELLAESRAKLTKMNFNHAVSPLENPNIIGAAKRNIARILTEINKRNKQEAKS